MMPMGLHRSGVEARAERLGAVIGAQAIALTALTALIALIAPAAARAQLPISEPFTGSAAPGWTLLGDALLTGGLFDPAGAGWLQLTPASPGLTGSAVSSATFPSGTSVVVTFEYADQGGLPGGDGFSISLLDAAAGGPTEGAGGGSLGYAGAYLATACDTSPLEVSAPGVTGGWLGVGFDEVGGFSGCEAGIGAPGESPQSIALRGAGTAAPPGTLQAAYRWLAGATLASVRPGATIDGVSRAAPRRVRLLLVNQAITVQLDLGSGFQTVVGPLDLASAPGQAPIPASFRLGLSAATGAGSNAHEVRDLLVEAPVGVTVTQSALPPTVAVGGQVTFTISVTNDGTNAAPGATLTDAFPAGLGGVSWSAATAGGATVGRTSGTGNLGETISLPRNGSVTYTVTATALAAAAGTSLGNTATFTPPAGLTNTLPGAASASVAVAKMTSATSLSVSPSPSTVGGAVTLTATVTAVAPGSGTPAGSVTFHDGAATLGTAALDGAGKATLATSALAVGPHSLTASYAGSASFDPSASSAFSHTVGQGLTTTSVLSSVNPSAFGQPVTFTATVTAVAPGGGTPAGTVTFLEGATTLATAPLDGAGAATFTTAALSVGAHTLTASYAATPSHLGSTSPVLRQAVVANSTTTSLSADLAPTVFGQPVTLTAAVVVAAPGTGTPTGAVTFRDGATSLGSAPLDAAGTAALTTAALPAGTRSLTASYEGAPSFAGSTSPVLAHTVAAAATATALSSSGTPSAFGQPVTLTATVAALPPGAGTPAGTVTFLDGPIALGTAALDAAGVATFAAPAFAVGTHALTAHYAGSTSFAASTSTAVPQVVGAAATATALAAAPAPSAFGQAVTLTATVAVVAPGAGTPTGLVTFRNGAASLGTAALDGTGTATLPTSALPVGSLSLTAAYAGTGSFSASTSPAVPHEVGLAATAVALASSAGPSVFGQTVTLTATVAPVAPGGGAPAGAVTFLDGAVILGSGALDGTGKASFATAALAVGPHALTAAYAGSASHAASASAALDQLVGAAATATALASSANPSVLGQAVTLTATVAAAAPGGGTPAGSVTFLDGAAELGTVALDGAGRAALATAALAAGPHSITAAYAGSTSHAASTSPALAQAVGAAATATALATSGSPSAFGQPVLLTATVTVVAPGTGTPAGEVTFLDGAAPLGTGTLDAAGVATFTTATLAVGRHTITASYGGSTASAPSTSPPRSQVVGAASTTTSLASGTNPSLVGQPVTLTATVAAVAPGGGTPAGTVTFFDGAASLGSAALDAAGVATLDTAALSVGSHSLTAIYGATASYGTSASAPVGQVVGAAATATALASSGTPSAFLQAVTFTATVAPVAPGGGTPAGTVTFFDGATSLGAVALDAAGQAALTAPALATGTHAIHASYGGSASHTASASPTVSQVVVANSTSTTLAAAPSSSVFGQTVTLTATVAVVAPGTGTPSGTVTFLDGSTSLGTRALDAAGVARLDTGALQAGARSLTASYGGSSSYAVSTSAPVEQVVAAASTATALSASPSPSAFGQAVTLTATVTALAPGGGTPAGTVTFFDGLISIGTGLLDGSGVARLTTATLEAGTHALTAGYDGSAGHSASLSITWSQVVGAAATTTALTVNVNPSVFGQPVTLTATVAPVPPAGGVPPGAVTFLDGTATLSEVTLDDAGVARLTTSALTAGAHTIRAAYAGAGAYGASSATAGVTVNRTATSVALTPAPSPALAAEPVTLTAQVTAAAPGGGTFTGSVAFSDGPTSLGSAPVDGAGRATLATSSLAVGSHTLTARYGGDAGFFPSTSPPAMLGVLQASTTTAVASSLPSSVYGSPVTFTATVALVAPSVGAPAGSVTFFDGGVSLGAFVLDAAGEARLTTTTLASGAHEITAWYGGSAAAAASTSAAITQQVSASAGAVTLAASVNPAVTGQPVLLTASIAWSGGVAPTGRVTFKDGAASLGLVQLDAAGQATLSGLTLAVGSHPLTASYPGDANYAAGTSAVLPLQVDPATTTTALSASRLDPVRGEPLTLTAAVAVVAPGAGAPTGTVTFTEGSTVLGTGPVGANGAATLLVSGPASLAVGAHDLEAAYGGAPAFAPSRSAALRLQVARAATAVALTSSREPVLAGLEVTFTAKVAVVSPGSGAPTGSVRFSDGASLLGDVPLDATGSAAFTTAALAVGSHAIGAAYGGDGDLLPASAGLTQTITDTQVVVTSSRNPSRAGRPVKLTAVVSSTGSPPAGMVTFKDGAAVLGSVALVDGRATMTRRDLGKGTHAITAGLPVEGGVVVTGTLPGGQVVENSPPVALAGTALRLAGGSVAAGASGPQAAAGATIDARGGALDTPQGTVEAWVRPRWASPAEAGEAPEVAVLGNATRSRWRLGLTPDRDGVVVVLGAAETTLPADLADGGWHHLALVVAGGAATLSVDGVVQGAVAGQFGVATSSTLSLGQGFTGELDEVRVWSTARTAAELAQAAMRPLTGHEPGLVGLWRLDERTGLELFDASASQLDGTIAPVDPGALAPAPFADSTAWTARRTTTHAAIAPALAGYDPDDDPLALTLTGPPAHGAATADDATDQLTYQGEEGWFGSDAIGFTLSDGTEVVAASLELLVDRVATCRASSDCGGAGALCISGQCRAGQAVESQSGGCGLAGGGAPGLLLGPLLGLLGLRRPRRREPKAPGPAPWCRP